MSDSSGSNSDTKALQGHTPGPWHVETEPQGSKGNYTQYTIQPHIADVFYMNQTGEANARLIAAAPDLLAALEEILEHVEWRRRIAHETTGPNDCTHRARAAINKARGQA